MLKVGGLPEVFRRSSGVLPEVFPDVIQFSFPGQCPALCGLLANNFERVSLRPLSVIPRQCQQASTRTVAGSWLDGLGGVWVHKDFADLRFLFLAIFSSPPNSQSQDNKNLGVQNAVLS